MAVMSVLLRRFRHSKDAVNATESMSHLLIRSLLSLGETDRLLDILRDKVSNWLWLLHPPYLQHLLANLSVCPHAFVSVDGDRYKLCASVLYVVMHEIIKTEIAIFNFPIWSVVAVPFTAWCPIVKESDQVNRKCSHRNTTVLLSTPCTDP